MTDTAKQKLIGLSRTMKWLCMAALIGVTMAALFAGLSLVGDRGALLANIVGPTLRPDRIEGWQLGAILVVNGVGVLFLCAALFALWEMFSEFAEGNILSPVPAQAMRKAGQHFLTAAVWSVIAHSVTVLLATMNNPPGERSLAVALNSHQLFPLLLAGVLFAVGHVLSEATRLEEENRSFV
ncbi:MAG: hypothetical protein AAFO77_05440 [Pseudomonadota bacterium]